MSDTDHPTIEDLFIAFGWEVTDEFRQRYWNDPWTNNLANVALNEHRRAVELEATVERLQGYPLPRIDMRALALGPLSKASTTETK